MRRLAAVAACAALFGAAVALAQEKREDRETKVRADKERVEADARWIYDDLPRGIAEAKKSRKPLLVVFRCIPCEACAKLDEDVVARDPMVAALLDKFVCVRIPHANGMDLSLFQFDYDQSWAAFFMSSDGSTVLGRYGTRSSQRDAEHDVSLEGFAATMEAVLDPRTVTVDLRKEAAASKPSPPAFARPEEFPTLKDRFKPTLDWQGKVVPSCMHCHMVREAERRVWRDAGKPIPDAVLFPYPNPSVLGLAMDSKAATRVRSVTPDSAASRAGFKAGDDIHVFGGQDVGSVADIQWVLHNVPGDRQSIEVSVARGDAAKEQTLKLDLAYGWRSSGDISWRASSWDLRRMVTGGMLLEDVSDEDRAKLGLDKTSMALRAKHVGQYGDHAAAKNAGFRKDDVLVSVAGKTGRLTESALLARLAWDTKPGDKLAVTVLRGTEKLELTLPMQ
jgi:serine protease Do